MDVIIYHNPDCGTSRNTLGLIRNAGVEPHVIEYLKTPPSRILLKQLIDAMGVSVRDIIREKGTPYAELGLRIRASRRPASRRHDGASDPDQSADRGDPVGVKLCRPSEAVLDILPVPQRGLFSKEDGEPVIDEQGRRVSAA